MRNVVLYCHIEKCAGTSLIKKFINELPFRAVNLLTNENTVTLKELKRTKRVYGTPKVISGHSINPTTFNNFKSLYPSISTFTIIREPCARLISNYLHDRTRGVWDGTLQEYISIPWKQNYLLRFLGGGNPDEGMAGYEKIDFKISVKNINRSFPILVEALGLDISTSVEKRNSFQQNKSDVPDDISVENGIKVGSYSISQEAYDDMCRLNQKDIEFYKKALEQEEAWLETENVSPKTPEASKGRSKGSKFLQHMEWLYRNMIYKPFVIRRVGYHALPRNAQSPLLTDVQDAF